MRNGGELLQEAVASVLQQTYGDFELLLVDDASDDGAVERLPSDPRIRVLRNERNLGQIASLNVGLRAARGAYVARLDHDDLCLPERLRRQVEVLDGRPEIALVASWYDVVDATGRLWARGRPRIDSFLDFATRVVLGRPEISHPTLTIRRDVLVGLGGFDESLGAAEDQELYRRLVLGRLEACVLPETLVRYRRHEGQMTVARAAAVVESDRHSHERFLAQLSPRSPAPTLSRLLMGEPSFWREPPLAEDTLTSFVSAAAERLRLDRAETDELARRLAPEVERSLLAGWTLGAPGYGGRARALAAFVAAYGDARGRALAAGVPALAATAPVGRPVAAARRVLLQLLRRAPLRGAASRSRLLRRLYTSVTGARLLDD